jgi:hypothetical protein
MKTALITLSDEGARLLAPLTGRLPEARLYIHESVRSGSFGIGSVRCETARPDPEPQDSRRFDRERHDPGRHETDPQDSARSDSEPEPPVAECFTKIADLTASLFPVCRALVYAVPCGVVVRAIAPLVNSKYEDPAIVVLDAGGRWAVSLLSGHEGGGTISRSVSRT